ncbi:putative reverse transcriptase domain-containing protein, partial [Tanacetum coccineum]
MDFGEISIASIGGIAGKNRMAEFQASVCTIKYPKEIPPLPWYRKTALQMAMAGLFSVVAQPEFSSSANTDDPKITMEEYIRLEEEKAHRRGKVYNWETATYNKIWDNKDVHDLEYVETEFPAIVFNDMLTSKTALSCEPMVSSLNNDEIDFRISFDESDDEDCTPTVSYFDDLDFFKDFEKEFPAIVYNDAQTSKLDFLTEPTLSPQHINQFNLKDETSLSEYDEEEQNVICFNDLFPFNVIYPNELKTDTDNDNDKVDLEHSSGDLSVKPLPDVINTDVGAYAHGSNKLLEI